MNGAAYAIVSKNRFVTVVARLAKVKLGEILSSDLCNAELFGEPELAKEHAAWLRKRHPRTKFEVRKIGIVGER